MIIKEEVNLFKRPAEITPDPGQYPDYIVFGQDIKPTVTMGRKYDWKPLTDGPGPGFYGNPPAPRIIGGYIEPEAPRLFAAEDARVAQSAAMLPKMDTGAIKNKSMSAAASASLQASPQKNANNASMSMISQNTKASKRDVTSPELRGLQNSLLETSAIDNEQRSIMIQNQSAGPGQR